MGDSKATHACRASAYISYTSDWPRSPHLCMCELSHPHAGPPHAHQAQTRHPFRLDSYPTPPRLPCSAVVLSPEPAGTDSAPLVFSRPGLVESTPVLQLLQPGSQGIETACGRACTECHCKCLVSGSHVGRGGKHCLLQPLLTPSQKTKQTQAGQLVCACPLPRLQSCAYIAKSDLLYPGCLRTSNTAWHDPGPRGQS